MQWYAVGYAQLKSYPKKINLPTGVGRNIFNYLIINNTFEDYFPQVTDRIGWIIDHGDKVGCFTTVHMAKFTSFINVIWVLLQNKVVCSQVTYETGWVGDHVVSSSTAVSFTTKHVAIFPDLLVLFRMDVKVSIVNIYIICIMRVIRSWLTQIY